MFRRKAAHHDMADVNVYTAKRLNDMANSLGELARACTDDLSAEQGLTKEDGIAALQTAAAMVCAGCNKCIVYSGKEQDNQYYLQYLVRAFEQKGSVDYGDMPRFFLETCKRKDEYMAHLNRGLGRATMNLAWKNRFLESRDAVIVQFKELAVILEEFSHQVEHSIDITPDWEDEIKRAFRRNHIIVEKMLILEYENHQREAFLTMRTLNGRCVTVKEAAEILENAIEEGEWTVAPDGRNLVTKQADTIRFVEKGEYRVLYGVAKAVKSGEEVSGDNYTFGQVQPGQVIMSLSDGMGSGRIAEEESRQVIELTQRLLEAGFSARAALKMVNTVLLLTGIAQHPATLDLCCIDLKTGILEAMKLGAAATYILSEKGVELLEAGEVPMGILNPVEPVLLSKKLWDDNRIIMVSDGVLDALPGDDKELMLKEFIAGMPVKNPQDMADRVLLFARSFTDRAADDMTVLTAGIWKRK
ncbi:SpoIIE family protein phosphatase [Lacrimispora saccharolytica]|uniref:Protein serine/threonine phosphatase n=1 Tax=Lacrimispora saccharolytica (strain ATCC 35040 / DSM 2544 / NRCC 2533 / WM1) TaxID=610130 RepID=D9R1P9_LACSW|nr:SpoIIE family protein phosphatase [Lacrimispora saccharolytica]ADL06572.1 protein serine/threonine phosphatase [[Clostridium] saccharolyticum WM1]